MSCTAGTGRPTGNVVRLRFGLPDSGWAVREAGRLR
jgi:hypothetical protein